MKLIYLWTPDYCNGVYFSNELSIRLEYKSIIKEGKGKVLINLMLILSGVRTAEALYGDNILGLNAVVGENGSKTSLLHSIMQSGYTPVDELSEPILSIYYDDEEDIFVIEKYNVEIDKIEGIRNVKYLDNLSEVKKCFVDCGRHTSTEQDILTFSKLQHRLYLKLANDKESQYKKIFGSNFYSSGGAALARLMINIDELVSEISQEAGEKGKKKDVVLLIDEIEEHFHPTWQKYIMQYLLDFLKTLYEFCRFQVVVSSYSPIILSDFMKNQIIRITMSNGKFNAEQAIEETFGSNSTHLYYYLFSMENGQIGELAKNLINEAIEYVHDSEASGKNDKIEYIIEHIGDEFIRRKLLAEIQLKKEVRTNGKSNSSNKTTEGSN